MEEWFERKIKKQRKENIILFMLCLVVVLVAGLLRVN